MNSCSFSINKWFLYPYCILLVAGLMLTAIYPADVTFRAVNGQFTPDMDKLMPWLTAIGEGVVVAILLLAVIYFLPGRCRKPYIFWAALAVGLTSALTHLGKIFYRYPRPLKYFEGQSWVHHLEGWPALYQKSFPSAHTSSAFIAMFIISAVLPVRHRIYGLHLLILSVLVAWSRIYLAAHFAGDVLAGSAIGVGVGIFSLLMLRHWLSRRPQLS